MSYSFSVNAATKDEAKIGVLSQFNQVVLSQPTHAKDKEAAVTAANAFIDLLETPSLEQEVLVTMWGSLSWNYQEGGNEPTQFTGGSVSITVGLRNKST